MYKNDNYKVIINPKILEIKVKFQLLLKFIIIIK